MDRPQAVGEIVECQGTFLQLNNLGQLFGDACTSTTHKFPKMSLLSQSYDKPRHLPSTTTVKSEEGRRPSDWSMASSNG